MKISKNIKSVYYGKILRWESRLFSLSIHGYYSARQISLLQSKNHILSQMFTDYAEAVIREFMVGFLATKCTNDFIYSLKTSAEICEILWKSAGDTILAFAGSGFAGSVVAYAGSTNFP